MALRLKGWQNVKRSKLQDIDWREVREVCREVKPEDNKELVSSDEKDAIKRDNASK